jgi:SPP1 family predicted phage head-tail adaptor
MEIGELRHKVTIERPEAGGRNERGGVREVFVPNLVDIWAEVLQLGPRERMLAQQVQSSITSKIRIRYRPGITAKMRVRWEHGEGGSPTTVEFFDIEGPPIPVQGRTNEIWLMCVKRDAEGYRTGART